MKDIKQKVKGVTAKLTSVLLVLAMFASFNPIMVVYAAEMTMDFDIITEVQEYGLDVTHLIIDTGAQVKAKSLDVDTFSVSALNLQPTLDRDEDGQPDVAFEGDRAITDVYVNDEDSIDGSVPVGQYIVIELEHGFTVPGSTAIYYSGSNYELDMNYTISQNKDFDLTRNKVVGAADYIQADTQNLIIDDFEEVNFNGQLIRAYAPESDTPLPLVLWNHGGGETYRPVPAVLGDELIGNEGAQLYANEGGVAWVQDEYPCYVLTPQRGDSSIGYSPENTIAYIDSLVAEGKVDRTRIYVGGCSAGGGETYRYLREFPEYFAAAFPICPGGTIDDDMAESIKDIPMWFFHATDDSVIPVDRTLEDLETLEEVGAKEVLFTEPEHVYYNEFGVEGIYPGHWSWIVALNNTYSEEYQTNLFDWLFSKQDGLTFDLIAEVQDYGLDVTHLIIDAGQPVKTNTLDLDTFSVTALNTMPTIDADADGMPDVAFEGEREITDIYVNNEPSIDGATGVGQYIVVELKSGFTVPGATALYYSMVNYYLDLDYTIVQNKEFDVLPNQGITVESFTQMDTQKLIVDDFDLVDFNGQSIEVYAPESDEALPLVLWNHGFGESYMENTNVLTGETINNEGAQLVANKGGVAWVQDEYPCYVVAPQRQLWSGTIGYTQPNTIAYIDSLVAAGKVDADRIYVAGCSMGGAETLSYLNNYSTYFAAAVPICPARIVDEPTALNIMDVPMWFFQAQTDTTVLPGNTNQSVATLEEVGAEELMYTLLPNLPYTEFGVDGEYPGHWSWIVPLNNYFSDEYDTNVFDWLFAH